MLCAHCATPVPTEARYCHQCGSLVSDAEGQASASASMDREALLRLENLLREETGEEFEVLRQLGRGGMAVVFLARDVHLARLVAIKVLPPELTFGHGVERFKREARTAAALDHPHIIPIYRVGTGGVLFWYAMKYVEGQSLDQLLHERGRLPLDETTRILGEVAAALDYAHRRGVVHRDIKPANVLLDAHDRAVVTDFGIAKALSSGPLTASGSLIGTPYFMSPEQWLGRAVSGSSDQYSVAVMAYRMLSGHVPFDGESAIEILQKHCGTPPPALERAVPGLPEHVYDAIARALEKKAEARFPTVGDLVAALRAPSVRKVVTQREAATEETATEQISPPVSRSVSPVRPRLVRKPRGAHSHAPSTGRRTRREFRIIAVVVSAAVVVLAIGEGVPRVRRAGGLAEVLRSATSRWSGSAPSTERSAGGPAASSPLQGPPTESESGPGAPQRADSAADEGLPREAGGAAEVAAPPPAPPARGVVMVLGLPRGGLVMAGGVRRQATFEMPSGEHAVELLAAGYAPQRAIARVGRGDTVRIRFSTRPLLAPREQAPPQTQPATRAAAILRIQVQPPSRIIVDGRDFGEQRTLVDSVAGGVPHVISIVPVRAGYARKDTTVTPRPGDTLTVRIRLEGGQ